MLNKRLITFSKNPERKNIIGPAFVRQVYQDLKNANESITFRAFLRRAQEQLENGNFDILSVNPNAISTNTVSAIRNTILEKPKLNYQFQELLERSSKWKTQIIQLCLKLLGIAYIEDGIFEDTQAAERNIWAFQQLGRSGLINYVYQRPN